jgi:hypothetical protein
VKPRSVGIQAKDIDTDALLRFIAPWSLREEWCMFTWIAEAFGTFPAKVVRAKLAALIRQKLIDGCTCGCRGDFELTETGAERIGVALPERSAGLRIDSALLVQAHGRS